MKIKVQSWRCWTRTKNSHRWKGLLLICKIPFKTLSYETIDYYKVFYLHCILFYYKESVQYLDLRDATYVKPSMLNMVFDLIRNKGSRNANCGSRDGRPSHYGFRRLIMFATLFLFLSHEMRWDEMRWDEMRWDEMRWDEMRWDEMRWDEMRWDEMRWDEMRWDEMRWDEMRWDEMRWDEMRWDEMRWDEMLFCQIYILKCRFGSKIASHDESWAFHKRPRTMHILAFPQHCEMLKWKETCLLAKNQSINCGSLRWYIYEQFLHLVQSPMKLYSSCEQS